jgi:serine/threonine protein kinase
MESQPHWSFFYRQEVASALAFLHGIGVVHADLKPENLLLCSKKRVDGTIKMIDFGCAIVHDEDEETNSPRQDLSDGRTDRFLSIGMS